MSALVMLFYWIVLPLVSILVAVFWLKLAKTPAHKWLARVVCAIWFIRLAWTLVSGEKIWLDMKVDRLCAKDGGIKVYETVTLSPDKFDKYGQTRLPPKRKLQPEDEYYYEWDIHYLQKGNPEMWRSFIEVFRKNDGKLLGESISYARVGGDLPGPWHSSSYSCPKESGLNFLEKKIFIQAVKGRGETR